MENCLCSSGNWDDQEDQYSDLAQCRQTGLNSDSYNTTSANSFLLPAPLGDPPPSTTHDLSSSFQLTGYAYNGFPVPTDHWSLIDGLEEEEEEDRSASASKNHSQAEKRRRDRINAHLATLRKLIPKSDKMDKATLLGSAVEQVKDLKRKALELGKVFSLPSELDQVIVDSSLDSDSDSNSYSNQCKENFFIKASVCCADRPELFSELKHAIKGLKLTTVEAHVTSLGGRIQGIFILCTEEDESKKLDGIGVNKLKQSLRVVLSRIIASSSTATNYRIKSKRQRFFSPSHPNPTF